MKRLSITEQAHDRWLKASVIGSTWGSFEIIMGSFLHNMKVPFAGTMMAFFSVLLMTAFLQHWRQKGIIWRAGLIAALMKSLSPSAFLLGPMTGIFLEALFFELSVTLLGLNMVAFLVGGGMSLLSALMHKLVNLLILYGKDFITIYENIIAFALRQFHDAGFNLEHVVAGLAILYVLAGILAALLGFLAGKGIDTSSSISIYVPVPARVSHAVDTVPANRSLVLLTLHVVMIPLLMYLNYRMNWYISCMSITLYVGLLAVIYPVVFRRLSKPMFWVQIAFMLLLSIIFLSSWSPETGLNREGLISGVRMNLRALLVIAAFAAIGFELRHEKIRSLFLSAGNPGIYNSLRISFGLLPAFLQLMNSPKTLIRHPLASLRQILAHADSLFNRLQSNELNEIT